jgi:aspartate racemase
VTKNLSATGMRLPHCEGPLEQAMTPLANERLHVGIVAGTADGAALCYRALCHEGELGIGVRRPEITMHTVPLDLYLNAIDHEDWKGVGALMSRSASLLAQAGAELIICPNNTLHRAFEFVMSPVPWLHIATAVRAEAIRRDFRRVGLVGTQVVMHGTVYQPFFEQLGVEIVLPRPDQRIGLDRIIRTELIRGEYWPQSRGYVQDIISTMAADGAEAVVLGCTELPLLLSDAPSSLPLLDSTRLLARAALTSSPLIFIS